MTLPVYYSAQTARLGLPLLFSGQSQKETTVNEALFLIDVLVGGGVSGVRNDPPEAPATGEAWIVGNSPVGDFTGRAQDIAGWSEGGWRFIRPYDGMKVHDLQSRSVRFFDGSWKGALAPETPAGGAVVDQEARSTLAAIVQALKDVGIFSNT